MLPRFRLKRHQVKVFNSAKIFVSIFSTVFSLEQTWMEIVITWKKLTYSFLFSFKDMHQHRRKREWHKEALEKRFCGPLWSKGRNLEIVLKCQRKWWRIVRNVILGPFLCKNKTKQNNTISLLACSQYPPMLALLLHLL